MKKIYTHKGIKYELEEIQGFYNCFVYAEGDSTPLFQTKYFASAEKAISEAINFIEDYHAYIETKRKKKRTLSRKPKKDKTKKQRTEIKEKGRITPTSKPNGEKSRTHIPKPQQEEIVPQPSMFKEEKSMTPPSMLNEEKNKTQSLKPQDSKRNRIAGILQALLILGAFLLIITIVAYGYSEYLVSRPRQVTPEATRTGVPGVGVSLPSPRETIVLPQVSQSQTPTPAVTPTLTITITTTSTITATSTFFTTQPSKTPRNTSRPTNPPIQTNTPSPTNTFTPAPTMTPTLSPAPTTGPPPPPWATPETPTPTPGT